MAFAQTGNATQRINICSLLDHYYDRRRAKTCAMSILDYGLLCRYANGDVTPTERNTVAQLTAANADIAASVRLLRAEKEKDQPICGIPYALK